MTIFRRLGLVLCLGTAAAVQVLLPTPGMAQLDEPVDPRAEKLLNDFLATLTGQADYDAAAKAAVPYLHKSVLSADGKDVSMDLRQFSFKKAWQNAKFYAQPVKITRIRKTTISAIGYAESAEKGKVSDYFVGKKEGVNGMPAPVKIFFPADGSAPKISYVGSL